MRTEQQILEKIRELEEAANNALTIRFAHRCDDQRQALRWVLGMDEELPDYR